SGRRAVRQRTARARTTWRQQPAAEVALRYVEGQTGALPPESARQARGLLRTFGDRGWPRVEAASVRIAEEDGARVVQAVHLSPAGTDGKLYHHQTGQGNGGAAGTDRLGHSGRGHQRPSRHAESCAHAPSPGHSGV